MTHPTAVAGAASAPSAAPLRIAIVGAESTGKTTLARDLAAVLAGAPAVPCAPAPLAGSAEPIRADAAAPRVALVAEVLREWCDLQGRTPRRDEQAGILAEQHRRIDAAAAKHDIVVCDTTALLTHVYSELLFGDGTLLVQALERHRTMAVTLLTALDLPWVADGHQRDGEHVRRPVDDRLRELLLHHRLPFSVVSGQGPARVAHALAALRPALTTWQRSRGMAPGSGRDDERPPGRSGVGPAPTGAGLFSRLARPARSGAGADATQPHGAREGSPAAGPSLHRRDWVCDCCVPEAERALARARAEARVRALAEAPAQAVPTPGRGGPAARDAATASTSGPATRGRGGAGID